MGGLDQKYIDALQTVGADKSESINAIFRWCVVALVDLADWLGITYEFINIIVFVVVWPLVTLALLVWVFALKLRIRKLKRNSMRRQNV